jgi:general secretion pathway protein D
MNWREALLPLVVVALVAGPAAAQDRVEVALAGQVELPRLVDLAAQRLGLNIEYDAAVLKGSTTLRLTGAMSDAELWTLTNRVLASRGFTTVRMPGEMAYSVVKLSDAPALVRTASPDSAPLPGPPAGYGSTVVQVEHRAVKEVVDAVAKVLSKPGGTATALGDGGLIAISDLTPRIEQALEVVRLVDAPSGPIATEEVPVRNTSAQALVTAAAQFSAKRDAVAGDKVPGEVLVSPNGNAVLILAPESRLPHWRAVITRLDQRERVETLTYSPRSFGIAEVGGLIDQTIRDTPDDRWRMVADDLTGALIVTATPSQHERIAALIQRLDRTPAAEQRPVRSFVIKNRPVKDVQAVLERLISAGVISASAESAAAPSTPATGTTPWPPPVVPAAAAPKPTAAPTVAGAAAQPGTPPATFTTDEGTNTLIAIGEPRVLAQVEALLASLDVRQPQVELEVLIVSLSDSQTLDLGLELEKLITAGDTRIRLSSLFGLGSRGPGGDRTVGDGLGLTGLVLNPGDFSIVLRALQTINKGRSLSMPRLLVANNEQAVLDSVLTQPYASTNASNTVTTTSFGGASDAGTQVTLKPQIAAGDHLNLDYSVSLSAFVGSAASPNLPPPRQQNKVQSAASLPDGHTVALGGIELVTDGQGTSQVPGLGSIPILGEVFKNRSKTASRSRFFVFVRANILRHSGYEDLKYLSGVAASQAGIGDGFPEVEPQIIR